MFYRSSKMDTHHDFFHIAFDGAEVTASKFLVSDNFAQVAIGERHDQNEAVGSCSDTFQSLVASAVVAETHR